MKRGKKQTQKQESREGPLEKCLGCLHQGEHTVNEQVDPDHPSLERFASPSRSIHPSQEESVDLPSFCKPNKRVRGGCRDHWPVTRRRYVREWLGGMQYPSEFPREFNIMDIPAEDEHSGDGVENPMDEDESLDGFSQDPGRAMTTANEILEKAWMIKFEAVMAMRPSCTAIPVPTQQGTTSDDEEDVPPFLFDDFHPSPRFKGFRVDYVFMTGPKGLGYYIDPIITGEIFVDNLPEDDQPGTTQPRTTQPSAQAAPATAAPVAHPQPHWSRQETERLLSIAHKCATKWTFNAPIAANLYGATGLAPRSAEDLRKKWWVLTRTKILKEIITAILEKNENEVITNIDLSDYYNEKGDMKRKMKH